MASTIQATPDLRRAISWGFVLAGLWVPVAVAQPMTTFHLAPLLIAATPPVLLALDERATQGHGAAVRAALGAATIAVVTTMAVASAGAMGGPAFGVFSSPLSEAITFIGLGSVLGFGFALWRRRRSASGGDQECGTVGYRRDPVAGIDRSDRAKL